ncbi:MAG: flagellar M-ring protein FliF [Comamonas sp.]|nr:flagellar M-ring protein FliF [Candidatus Comamonas equi]
MQRLLLPLLLTAAIVTAVVVMLLWQNSGNYRPLFGARENIAVSDVVGVLDSEGLRYRLHPESGQVLVADKDLAHARMLLAAKGVSAKLPEGLELMDRNDPLGVSQFVQDVRFRRGLEGELSRSIATLDVVQSARVHLSIARSSSFVVNTGDKSSASVVLQLKPGQELKREQIAAVIHMVASSVAGLSPQRVSLTDQAGNFLSARVDLSEGFDPQSQDDQVAQVSEELRRNAQELLTATLGANHFRVTVTADVSQDRTEETYEQYSGDPRILNEATREENDRKAGVALGVPGSLSNRPINLPEDSAKDGKDANGNFRAAVSRNYAYDRSVVQVKRGKGRINKLHVAVVLDDAAAPDAATPWKPEELARIEKLLRVGMGIDALRGDQLAVSSMAFKQPAPLPTWWEDPANWYEWIVTALWAIGALAVLILLSRLVKGVLNMAAVKPAAPALATQALPVLAAADQDAGKLPLSSSLDAATPAPPGAQGSAQMSMVPLLENVDLPPPGSQVDVMVEHLRTLAAKEPERVAEVVKQWVQKHSQPAANEA